MTMFRYLSPEWREAAAEIRRRFVEAHGAQLPSFVANITVTGVPFGDGVAELHSLPGVPNVFDEGHVDDADAELTIDYSLARLILFDDGTNLLQLGIGSGQIEVTGDVDALRSYWHSHIGDASYLEMLEALRAITK